MNPFADVNWNPSSAEKRKFALSLIIGFPLLAGFFSIVLWIATHSWKPFFLWLALLGFAVGVILWLLPAIARPFYVVWYFIACCLGYVVGNFLLVAFYYLVITPIGFFLRGRGRLSLRKGFDPGAGTYWREVEKTVDSESYYRQF
jgi:hypothetical protein